MKKTLLLFGGACVAAMMLSGCAGVAVDQGAPGPGGNLGMNFYSDVKVNTMIMPVAGSNYTVLRRDVKAQGKLMSYFTCVTIGDLSYESLRAKALSSVPGAQELIDVKLDYASKNVCGIHEITVRMTATAIRFNK